MRPYRCTGTMPRVRGPMCGSTGSGRDELGALVHIGEASRGADERDRLGGRDERVRGHDHLVPRADPACPQGERERVGSRGDAPTAARASQKAANFLLEGLDLVTQRERRATRDGARSPPSAPRTARDPGCRGARAGSWSPAPAVAKRSGRGSSHRRNAAPARSLASEKGLLGSASATASAAHPGGPRRAPGSARRTRSEPPPGCRERGAPRDRGCEPRRRCARTRRACRRPT